jgi:hypothetical protein
MLVSLFIFVCMMMIAAITKTTATGADAFDAAGGSN